MSISEPLTPKPYTPTREILLQRYIEATTSRTDPLELVERAQEFYRGIAQIEADLDKPSPCVMTHTEPFDFAQCETHDTTFALGDTCPWDGVESIAEKLQDDVDEQRGLKVRAQHELEYLQAGLAGHVPTPCARCGRRPVLVPATDPENFMDMRVCWECDVLLGTQMREEHEGAIAAVRGELADANAALARVRQVVDAANDTVRTQADGEHVPVHLIEAALAQQGE